MPKTAEERENQRGGKSISLLKPRSLRSGCS